jgi:hypothetical protein
MLFHANEQRELQGDKAMLPCEIWNIICVRDQHLLFKRVENTTLLYVKTISKRNTIYIVREIECILKKIVSLSWIWRICNGRHGHETASNCACCQVRIPTFPTVGVSSRQVKLRICSQNYVECKCCVREFRKFVFEEPAMNCFLFINKLNPAFTFHYNIVSGTSLTWPKQHNWLTRPVGLESGQI